MTENNVEPPIRLRFGREGQGRIHLPRSRVPQVREALEKHLVPFWVDSDSVSWRGRPFTSLIFLGQAADLDLVRKLLEEIG